MGTPPKEVLVVAPEGARFAELRAALAAHVADGCADFAAGGRPVADDDVVGQGGLVRGAVLTVGAAAETPDRMPPGRVALLELAVVGGPGAGRTRALRRGQHVVGRGISSVLRLDDPAVSRSHCVITVGDDGIRLRDLDPTNHSTVDGRPVPEGGQELVEGTRLRLADTTIEVRRPDRVPAATEPGAGVVRINRRPRFVSSHSPVVVAFPAAPERTPGVRAPVIASLAPLVLSVLLATVLRSPSMLLFALMSPVMMLGQWWGDRRHGRLSHRAQVAAHARATDAARERLALALAAEERARRTEAPDLAFTGQVAEQRDARLWERRVGDPDHMVLRVGTADQPARTSVEAPSAPGPAGEATPGRKVPRAWPRRRPAPTGPAAQVVDTAPSVKDAPALLDLRRTPVVGVSGPRARVRSLAGSAVVQLATWHSPRHLRLVLLTTSGDPATDWLWLTHLPHAQGPEERSVAAVASAADPGALAARVAQLEAFVGSRVDLRRADRDAVFAPVVVVLDGSHHLRGVPGVAALLTDGPAVGLHFLCLDETPELLPAEASAQLTLGDSPAARALLVSGDAEPLEIVPDLPGHSWVERVARALAPLEDATPDDSRSAMPDRVGFAAMHREADVDVTSSAGIRESWARSDGRPLTMIGTGREGAVVVDLAKDGPHALVGGTTGAGKSELLQALVAGLATATRPDELGFVLVDYKGGSAFKECARLPHTLGVVTDLDSGLTARALTSLGAEVKRREALLAQAGAKDLDDYRRLRGSDPTLPRVPRLVLVVDEFKMLADELPDFVDGLVRIAAVGRSLGIHLVLATQRPGGIVTGDMRANISLRIALRVRDRSDSDDVIESPVAADISDRTPGRAWLRAADGNLVELQAAYVGGPAGTTAGSETPRLVLPLSWDDVSHGIGIPAVPQDTLMGAGAVSNRHELPHPPPASELAVIVEATRWAARELGVTAGASPWLPPLPATVRLDDLRPSADSADRRVVLGLADLPDLQAQQPVTWHPSRDGNLGVAGGARTGRTTLLRTVAHGLAERHRPTEVHLHVLEGAPGSLADLAALPHVGSVTGVADPALAARVIRRLGAAVSAGRRDGAPLTVLLVDGWESLESALEGVDHGEPTETLLRIARDGSSVGVHVVVAGGRAVVSGRLSSALQRRLVLPMPDPLDLTLAGLSPAQSEGHRHVGRAVMLPEGHSLQVAHVGDDPSTVSQGRATQLLGELVALAQPTEPAGPAADPTSPAHPADITDPAALPWTVRPLPVRVTLGELTAPISPGNPRTTLVLGAGGDDAGPCTLDLDAYERRLLVVGPARSGRSTALEIIARQLADDGRDVAAVAGWRSALRQLSGIPGVHVLGPDDDSTLRDLLAMRPGLSLLVDDVETLDGTPVEAAAMHALAVLDAADDPGFVAASVDARRAAGLYRGLVPELARHGTGIVLQPATPTDGEVLGARVEPVRSRVPGRGVLVRHGQTTPLQVAAPAADSTESASESATESATDQPRQRSTAP